MACATDIHKWCRVPKTVLNSWAEEGVETPLDPADYYRRELQAACAEGRRALEQREQDRHRTKLQALDRGIAIDNATDVELLEVMQAEQAAKISP